MNKSYTLIELAKLTQNEIVGDGSYEISNVDGLEGATPTDISFLANPKYQSEMRKSKAGAICVDRKTPLDRDKNYLISDDPSKTFQQIVSLFSHDATESGFKGIHPTAVVHQTAKIGKEVSIGPFAVIDRNCIVGDQTKIHAHVTLYPETQVGQNCIIHSHVTLREGCIIKDRVILQPGVVIGGCGFGYLTSDIGRHTKIRHFGNVIIEDDVEIGSNTTVDRARFKTTSVGRGSKIDNLVMLAHNVSIGEDNLIVAQTGISGSAKTGKHVVLAGQVGVVGHIEIASGTVIMARGAPSKSILEKGVYGGAPALPRDEYHKSQIHLKRLSEYVERIKKLEDKLALLEREESTC